MLGRAIVTAIWCALIIGLNAPYLEIWLSGTLDQLLVERRISYLLYVSAVTSAFVSAAALLGLMYVKCLWVVVVLSATKACIEIALAYLAAGISVGLVSGYVGAGIWLLVGFVSYLVIQWNYGSAGLKRADVEKEFD